MPALRLIFGLLLLGYLYRALDAALYPGVYPFDRFVVLAIASMLFALGQLWQIRSRLDWDEPEAER